MGEVYSAHGDTTAAASTTSKPQRAGWAGSPVSTPTTGGGRWSASGEPTRRNESTTRCWPEGDRVGGAASSSSSSPRNGLTSGGPATYSPRHWPTLARAWPRRPGPSWADPSSPHTPTSRSNSSAQPEDEPLCVVAQTARIAGETLGSGVRVRAGTLDTCLD